MKTCSKCKIEKPFEDFYRATNTKSGYRGRCRSCTKEQQMEYLATDAGKATKERYRVSEKGIKANATYLQSQKYLEKQDRYEGSAKGKAKNAKYRQSNKGKDAVTRKKNARRALLNDTTSDNWLASEVFESADWKCFYCGVDVVQPNRVELGYQPNEAQPDHFTPIAKGGTNERKNIVCSCGQCNLSKNDKNPFEFIRDNINQLED